VSLLPLLGILSGAINLLMCAVFDGTHVRFQSRTLCRAIAAASLHLQRDPIYEDVLGRDAFRLASASKLLLEGSTKDRGAQVLRLAVVRRLLLQILDRKEVVVWLARDHPETLSILMNASGFDGLGFGDIDEVPMPPRTRKQRWRET